MKGVKGTGGETDVGSAEFDGRVDKCCRAVTGGSSVDGVGGRIQAQVQ